MKLLSRRLLSRKQFLGLGISTATTLAILSLGKLKVLSYLIYLFKHDRQARKLTIVGKSSLKQRAKAKGLIYGAFPQADDRDFRRDRQLQSHFIRECAMMTVGCYWIVTRPSLDTFDFTGTDYFAKFAATNKLLLRGHPLIWHEALPKWLPATLNSNNAEQILTKHIKTIVRRYTGKMHSWDVINEAIDVGDKRIDGLRETPWLKFLGID
jgi:endo-1,4-beta-xylanase